MPANGSTLEEAMLSDSLVYTTLPVTDPARARAFYAEKLGLRPTQPDGDFYECGGGTRFVISLMGSKPGGHTQMGFLVDDIEATVKDLKSKGVVFEDYDFPSLKTVGGIADRGDMKVAWFKDSEGNMLGMSQPVDESVRAAMGPPPLVEVATRVPLEVAGPSGDHAGSPARTPRPAPPSYFSSLPTCDYKVRRNASIVKSGAG